MARPCCWVCCHGTSSAYCPFCSCFSCPGRPPIPKRGPKGSPAPSVPTTHRPGQRFCTNCGWDLNEVYTPESTEHYNIPAPMAPMVEDSIAGVETAAARSQDASAVREVEPSSIEGSRPVIAQAVEAPPTAEEARPVTAQAADAADPAMAQTAEPVPAATEPGPAAGQPAEAAPATAEPRPVMGQDAEARPADQDDGASAPAPWGVPPPGPPPTAATMTARGMRLFSDGRTQEAIDQFTKAIALDPSFPEAWETPCRSLFEARQGRGRRRRSPDIERVGRDVVAPDSPTRLIRSENTAPRHHKKRPPNGGLFLSRRPVRRQLRWP